MGGKQQVADKARKVTGEHHNFKVSQVGSYIEAVLLAEDLLSGDVLQGKARESAN